ncbi:uncharacterized protein LOC125619417 [Marmota marmota marmota]|uniref:uncharacterized protein LOC125619417 n=1 Tax=Marmota marmota marmota TaxID=9994 RepID=UPI0020936AA2|nr:uncharacterized protein LOC125619417 [Marmota marmota marmota]
MRQRPATNNLLVPCLGAPEPDLDPPSLLPHLHPGAVEDGGLPGGGGRSCILKHRGHRKHQAACAAPGPWHWLPPHASCRSPGSSCPPVSAQRSPLLGDAHPTSQPPVSWLLDSFAEHLADGTLLTHWLLSGPGSALASAVSRGLEQGWHVVGAQQTCSGGPSGCLSRSEQACPVKSPPRKHTVSTFCVHWTPLEPGQGGELRTPAPGPRPGFAAGREQMGDVRPFLSCTAHRSRSPSSCLS